jgi:hypothetical protein
MGVAFAQAGRKCRSARRRRGGGRDLCMWWVSGWMDGRREEGGIRRVCGGGGGGCCGWFGGGADTEAQGIMNGAGCYLNGSYETVRSYIHIPSYLPVRSIPFELTD